MINAIAIDDEPLALKVIQSFCDKSDINEDDVELKSGDVVDIEMQCIDKNVALYYTTLALIGNSGPGGGTTPNNPPNNISGGALGLFLAGTTERHQVIVP